MENYEYLELNTEWMSKTTTEMGHSFLLSTFVYMWRYGLNIYNLAVKSRPQIILSYMTPYQLDTQSRTWTNFL